MPIRSILIASRILLPSKAIRGEKDKRLALFQDTVRIVDSNEVITTDRYLAHAMNCEECTYMKSELMYSGGTWREEKVASLFSSDRTPNIIFGHSDRFISSLDLLYAKLLGYKKVYGVNTKPKLGFSTPLPLGLTNQTTESEFHKLFGNHSLLVTAFESTEAQKSYNGTVTGNFSIETNLKKRLPLARILESKFGAFNVPDFSENGRLSYLKNIRKSNFVVCPEGNGVDTHRLWETLYMGSIPIIIENDVLEELVRHLPVLVIKNWNQISDDNFLESAWIRISQSEDYDFSLLEVSSWINLLH